MPRRIVGPRAYVRDMVVQLGPLMTTGRLVPVIATGAREYKEFTTCCPDCEEPNRPSQGYTCDQGHGPYSISQLHRAKDVGDGTLVRVSQEEYEAARRSSLPLNRFVASVHPKDQFEAITWDAENAYVLQPDTMNDEFALMVKLVRDTDKVFVAVVNLRHSEGLFRLAVWGNNLVVQKVLWPAEVNTLATPGLEVDVSAFNAAAGMLERISADFDPDTYQSSVKARLEELTASLSGEEAVVRLPSPEPKYNSLLERLNAFG